MSVVDPCERHGVSNCAYCRPTTASVQRDALTRPLRGPWFIARFSGPCSGCDSKEIQPGDEARADGEGGYLCTDCGHDGAIVDL